MREAGILAFWAPGTECEPMSMSSATPPTTVRHRKAIAFMIVAAICWSTGGILVRQLSITNAWEIVFWRSLFMALFVAGVLAVMHGRAMPRAVRAIGLPGALAGLLLAGTFFLFIGSLTHTTVANTFVLMSVSPLLAAVAGWFVLGERVPRRTWIALFVAGLGIAIMFGGGVSGGRLLGNLMALGVSVCFAAQLMVLRKFHATVDMLPQVMIAGLWTLVPAFVLAGPFAATPSDLAILALMGCVQLGIGCLLATAASRTLAATELSLLALLEPILGPLWVWVLLGENPGHNALVGGAIVLCAVVGNAVFAIWRARVGARQPLPRA
jgi:drug/metabolite transporter (DMT)-like permease